MSHNPSRRWPSTAAAAAAAAAMALAAGLPAQAATYSGVYAFGDSLSDNGNLFALTGGLSPASPYVGGRFSNGPVAIEYVAASLGLNLHDYAYGGATSGTLNVNPLVNSIAPTGLLAQVSGFGTAMGGVADGQGLYFVYAGANDFLSANPATPIATVIGTTIGNLTNAVGTLYGMGARSFVLPTLPDLGKTVAALNADAVQPGYAAGATQLSLTFNQLLLGAYGQLAAALPSETFMYVDTVLAQTSALAEFQANGGNVSQSCLSTGANPACSGYFYFDDIHPTTAAHRLFSAAVLNAVPEPGSWALAGLALLGVGLASRRRPQRVR